MYKTNILWSLVSCYQTTLRDDPWEEGLALRKLFITTFIFVTTFFIVSFSFAAQLSHKEFLSTDFIKYFKNREYANALKANDALLKKYPHDALILRYRALTLEKLNHSHEAIKLYRAILIAHPNDIPARLFVGLAYI